MNVVIRRILTATDFSEPARYAQHYAMAFAEQFGSEFHLLHVVQQIVIPLPDATTSWTIPAIDQKLQLEEAQSRVLREISHQWAAEHRAKQTAVLGYPVEEISGMPRQKRST